jgi:DNA polymerase-3 subunit gamma/tau
LTDQSIAFGDGKITDADVRVMLGTIDQSLVYDVLQALIAEDVAMLLQAVADLAEHSPDYSAALAELIATLHRVAIAQALPEAVDNSLGDRQQIYTFAQAISAEDVQLYYQTALLGRRDLPLVPDPRSGFEMVLLRMLAFKPQGVSQLPKQPLPAASIPSENIPAINEVTPARESPVVTAPVVQEHESVAPAQALSQAQISSEQVSAESNSLEQQAQPTIESAALASQQEVSDTVKKSDTATELAGHIEPTVTQEHSPASINDVVVSEPVVSKDITSEAIAPEVIVPEPVVAVVDDKPVIDAVHFDELVPENWYKVYAGIETGGLLQSTVANCQFIESDGQHLYFVLDEGQSTLYDDKHQIMLADLLSAYFSQALTVTITVGQVTSETPAQRVVRCQQERQRQAEGVIANDPVVQQLEEIFDARIINDSIKPI